jgi:hypothetical protein
VYRKTLRRPNVLHLHEWNLHNLVLSETHLKKDTDTYDRLMFEAYKPTKKQMTRDVLLGRKTPLLESIYPLSEHLVAGCRKMATTTALTCSRAAAMRPDLLTLHLPLHTLPPVAQIPSREKTRDALGLTASAFVMTTPGLINPLKKLGVSLRSQNARRGGARTSSWRVTAGRSSR